jgi:hypothetical protein
MCSRITTVYDKRTPSPLQRQGKTAAMSLFNSASYQPLDANKRQIRLLTIYSYRPKDRAALYRLDLAQVDRIAKRDTFVCTLKTVYLDDGVMYDALSYVWGDPDDRVPIIVNDGIFLATRSLYEAIKGLHRKDAISFHLWADAVCINQLDFEERGQQVSIMGDIFRNAQTVHAWIGNSSPATDMAMHYLITANSDSEDEEDPFDEDLFDALRTLAIRPWFIRLWVAQEVCVAREAWIHCGAACTSFHNLRCHYTNFVGRLFTTGRIHDRDRLLTRFRRVSNLNCTLNSKDLSQVDETDVKALTDLFICAKSMHVSDPRDFVYALRGIMPRAIDIIPNYALSPGEVFQNATLALIVGTKSLSWLELAAGIAKHRFDPPSWAIALPAEQTFLPMGLPGGPSQFKAAGGLDYIASHDDGQKILKVAARFCDEFDDESTTAASFIDQTHLEAVGLKALRDLRCSARDATLYTEKNLRVFQQRFWSTLCEGILASENDRKVDIFTSYNSEQFDPWGVDHYVMDDADATAYQLLRWWGNVRWAFTRTQFFITASKRFAMADPATRSGDKIAVLAGSNVPFVLRPMKDHKGSVYQLVRSCYCEG